MNTVEINKHNIQTYLENGLSNSSEDLYTCTLCGSKTCIEDSYSDKGNNMVCNFCFRNRFHNDSTKMFKWIRNTI